MKPVTRWSRLNCMTNIYEHQHIEAGHVQTDKPTPMGGLHARYIEREKWRKQFGYLNEDYKFIPMMT
jgi:hypothetical protein